MSNNPFQNSKFTSGPPTNAPWEGGPLLYVPPYNGQNQVAHINTANPPPPWEDGPGPVIGNPSKIPS